MIELLLLDLQLYTVRQECESSSLFCRDVGGKSWQLRRLSRFRGKSSNSAFRNLRINIESLTSVWNWHSYRSTLWFSNPPTTRFLVWLPKRLRRHSRECFAVGVMYRGPPSASVGMTWVVIISLPSHRLLIAELWKWPMVVGECGEARYREHYRTPSLQCSGQVGDNSRLLTDICNQFVLAVFI